VSGRLVVLGATGMLGSAIFGLAERRGLEVSGTTTDVRHAAPWFRASLVEFKGAPSELGSVVGALSADDYVVNCVGLIKHHIVETDLDSRQRAIGLNALLPHHLDAAARAQGFRVIQIATDCVYSGSRGMYTESDPHDASDVYGQTKSLGEVPSPQFIHLRASIVGRELRTHRSLIDWALGQPNGARATGFSNHIWNGVSTVAFAKVALGMIAEGIWTPGTFHLTPADVVSKAELLRLVFCEFGRDDVRLEVAPTDQGVDRSLRSADERWNERLWAAGGYSAPPTVGELVAELGRVQGSRP
jgi:dTDP-4-dehydrorhamnose reductase